MRFKIKALNNKYILIVIFILVVKISNVKKFFINIIKGYITIWHISWNTALHGHKPLSFSSLYSVMRNEPSKSLTMTSILLDTTQNIICFYILKYCSYHKPVHFYSHFIFRLHEIICCHSMYNILE